MPSHIYRIERRITIAITQLYFFTVDFGGGGKNIPAFISTPAFASALLEPGLSGFLGKEGLLSADRGDFGSSEGKWLRRGKSFVPPSRLKASVRGVIGTRPAGGSRGVGGMRDARLNAVIGDLRPLGESLIAFHRASRSFFSRRFSANSCFCSLVGKDDHRPIQNWAVKIALGSCQDCHSDQVHMIGRKRSLQYDN